MNEKAGKILDFYKARKNYRKLKAEGNDTYKDFARVVTMSLNILMPSVRGMHRDHIIPASFCRKLGLTPLQTNHPKNLRYIKPQDNIDKWSYIEDYERDYLHVMCKIWNIPYPDEDMILAHNKEAARTDKAMNSKNVHRSFKG